MLNTNLSSPLLRQINYWSDLPKSNLLNDSVKLNYPDDIAKNIISILSDQYKINFKELKILEKITKNYYWFISLETGILYHLNIFIEKKLINSANHNFTDHKIILSEFGKTKFTQINCDLSKITHNQNVYPTIYSSCNNEYLIMNNISFDNHEIDSVDKPSRQLRLERRILLNSNNSNKRNRDLIENEESTEYEEHNEMKQNKKRKVEKPDVWNEMVSASAVRNYLLKDPLLDYLNEFNIYSIEDKPSAIPNSLALKDSTEINESFNTSDSFTKSIMEAGIEFENELVQIIKKNHPVVKVAEYYQAKLKEKYIETINEMKKGTLIIYQGVLHNYANKTFGMPDLIVRSDYINKLLGYPVVSDDEAILPSPKLKKPYHYKIIDIKHSTIPIRADSIHILNSDSIPAYKGQIYIYTHALNQILGININKAYIWGKKYYWKTHGDSYESLDFLKKLGTIDYDSVDLEYVNKTNEAINWIKTMRKEGSTWNLLPVPSKPELYPNMKNDRDGKFHKIKLELNESLKDITSITYCGVSQREKAHSEGIYDWENPECNAKIMGFNMKGKQAKLVDSVLFINRQKSEIILPKIIMTDRNIWKNVESNIMEFYIDFETTNSNFGSIIKDGIIKYDSCQYIFMIGIGWVINDVWNYKCFIMEEKNDSSETLMFKSFHELINKLLKENSKSVAKFYHWSKAEILAYNRFKSKQDNEKCGKIETKYEFYDLYKLFISEPITVKGALNYSLKTIAKNLYSNGLIKSNWNNLSPCSNGLNAMILANKVYDNIKNGLVDSIENDDEACGKVQNFPIMRDIQNYNQVDCKVLWEILKLLRTL